MNITLDCGIWYANGYTISGDESDGYFVYPEGSADCSYSSLNFEDCLTWIYNS